MRLPSQEKLFRQIESFWISSGAWPDLIAVMRLALFSGNGGKSRWLHLPALCCQAAGGDPQWAENLTAAWLLYYAAAHLMDSVQDQDDPDPWWAESGAGSALSAATGLYFSAGLLLNQLHDIKATQIAAADIASDFYRGFLVLSSGQLRDLERPEPSLEEYWTLAEAKSGIFFALACRNGARLAIEDAVRLVAYAEYGRNLGVIIQVLDDLDDVVAAHDNPAEKLPPQLLRALPYVYALEVLPSSDRDRLRLCAHNQGGENGKAEALGLIDLSAAATYTLMIVEQRKNQALSALRSTLSQSEAARSLEDLVRGI